MLHLIKRRHIIPISGKDSLATAIIQRQRQPDLKYEYMFNPTGAELPEVFEWLERVELYLGAKIIRVGDNLEEIIEDKGYYLPGARSRYCTKEAKIEPMERYLRGTTCNIYYGIRVDEKRTGYTNPSGLLTPVMPLVEEGIGIEGVYEIILSHGLKPPVFFWQSVFDEVARRMGGLILYTSY